MKKRVYLFGLLIMLSCSQSSIHLNQLEWMLGTREAVVGEKLIREVWEKENDSLLVGKSYEVTSYDTTLTETIELKSVAGTIYYIPLVFDQNNREAIMFQLNSSNPEQLVFENPEHDFPQKIVYYKEGDNINAWIEGNNQKIEFYFMKVQ